MKLKNIVLLTALTITTNLFIGCSSVSNLTGDKLMDKSDGNLVVQSNVEMTDTSLNSMAPGKIKEVNVKEGDTVEEGQVLVTIDSDAINAQKAQVEAQIETVKSQLNATKAAKTAAESQLEKAQNGAQPEEIAQAKASYDLLQQTYDRVKVLVDEGASTQADLDNAKMQLEVAKNKYELAQKGAREEDIKAAQAQVDQASASVEAVEGQLKQAQAGLEAINVSLNNATITAPTSGIITQLNVEAGEMVSAGMPVLVITNTAAPAITCNIKETDISKIKLDEDVKVSIPAYKDQTFDGKVTKINKNADFATKRATNDNGEFDILSYGVKVELTDMNEDLHGGMTAFVDFGK